MGSHSTHAKKEGKKQKQGSSQNQSAGAFFSRPVFVPPTVIKKDKGES